MNLNSLVTDSYSIVNTQRETVGGGPILSGISGIDIDYSTYYHLQAVSYDKYIYIIGGYGGSTGLITDDIVLVNVVNETAIHDSDFIIAGCCGGVTYVAFML